MINAEIEWPVRVIYVTDPELNLEARDIRSLETDVEYWNCPSIPDDDLVVIRDGRGRLLSGVICDLQVQHLDFDSSEPPTDLENLLDLIEHSHSLQDRMRAVELLQRVDDDSAVTAITTRFTASSDPYALLLAISALTARATGAHRPWLRSILDCVDVKVSKAVNWAMTLFEDS